ncbi:YcnI family copper-binding membrane protein [Streptomyces abyssomicinicus]|uniref:YcnI family copper-binding membrane protein n=1 Tax=Streptomyces abyssomicinicus TaxID=574929 RepID=UPI00124FA9E8|nr:YcnI family protein [Streptomyces abyssomicinicus]
MKATRIAAALAAAGASVLLLSSPSFAHVSVQPEGAAAKGGYATVAFKVPNERDNASTTKLEVNFPADHPLASVMPQPVQGWDVEVTRSKLDKPLDLHGRKVDEAITKIVWTAEDEKKGGIQPGFFQKFPVSVGPLPEDSDELVFKSLQTYSNGEVVRWIELQEGEEEPEKPAPVLQLSAAAENGHGTAKDDDSAASGKNAEEAHEDDVHESAAGATDTAARVLGVVGIVIGVAGVAFGVLARRRTA